MSTVLRKAWKSKWLEKESLIGQAKSFIHDSSFQLDTELTGISMTIQVGLALPVDLKGTS